MDLRAVVIVSLLLITAGFNQATLANNTSFTPNASSTEPSSSKPVLGILSINLTSECKGNVLIHLLSNSTTVPACLNEESIAFVRNLTTLSNVCQNHKGCNGTPSWKEGSSNLGYNITDVQNVANQVTNEMQHCRTLSVECKVEKSQKECPTKVHPQQPKQGRAYKVATALLTCVLLIILLMRFTRPTVKALQKRLSDRRQNRWIGPTQSHSVSYHRGKSAVNSNDDDKRLSSTYSALERLAVANSREPSSNRNSDYNL